MATKLDRVMTYQDDYLEDLLLIKSLDILIT